MKPRLGVLCTAPVGCILIVTQLMNPANALAPDPLVITLVTAPSMANIGLQSKDDTPRILYEDMWDLSVLEPFASFLNPKEPHCPVLHPKGSLLLLHLQLLNSISRTRALSLSPYGKSSME
jgi:hypothetical protein